MLVPIKYILCCSILLLYLPKTCTLDQLPVSPSLVIKSPGEMEYTDVLVKTVDDNLTLVCELRGDTTQLHYVWNYIPQNDSETQRPYTVAVSSSSSQLTKQKLQLSDSGQYMCSAPPFSVTKYIVVQTAGSSSCARGAFRCGRRCVLPAYVCDGRQDCVDAEDEHVTMCGEQICSRGDKLKCSLGRCIPEAACCRNPSPLCRQPTCCDEYQRYSRLEGLMAVEDPQLFEDRHAPDDYGFIQSTIYTVTACALIFMVAVVVLVSAVCKLHMKRAALRGYSHADRAASHHYANHYAQTHRFPPCYEASRLVDEALPVDEALLGTPLAGAEADSQHSSPTRQTLQCNTECPESPPPLAGEPTRVGLGLSRLSAIFSSRYRQVPTQPAADVEMTAVRPSSLNTSPRRSQLQNYRSPTYCDLESEYFMSPESPDSARELNFLTPVDFFRRRARRNTLERVMDQIDRQRLTLQVGRFQLTLPSFSRDRRPDTPNVGEVDINDLDFVRINSSETYTLNGRTIRLLGANFENYPVMPDGSVRPPPYTEAMRYKLYGPPPEYLSREGLNRDSRVDEDARNNIEMPPCYDDLASGGTNVNINNNVCDNVNGNSNLNVNNNSYNAINVNGNCNNVDNNNTLVDTADSLAEGIRVSARLSALDSLIAGLPPIDCDANANEVTSPPPATNTAINNVIIPCNDNE